MFQRYRSGASRCAGKGLLWLKRRNNPLARAACCIAAQRFSSYSAGVAQANHHLAPSSSIIESSPSNLDPRQGTDAQSERVGALIFDGLVKKDEHYNLQPWLATSWDQPDRADLDLPSARWRSFSGWPPARSR